MRPHVEIRRDGPSGFAVAISSRRGALDTLLPLLGSLLCTTA